MTKDEYKDFLSLMEKRDKVNISNWLSTFNTDSATECFTAVQELKRGLDNE